MSINTPEPEQTVDGEKQQAQAYFKKKIDFCIKWGDYQFDRMVAYQDGDIANAKSFHAFAALTFSELQFIYEHFSWLVCRDIEMAYENRDRLANLEEMIKKIGEQTGVDLSKLSSELENIKTKVKPEEIATIVKFAEAFNKQIEESKKKIEEYQKRMRENDLAE